MACRNFEQRNQSRRFTAIARRISDAAPFRQLDQQAVAAHAGEHPSPGVRGGQPEELSDAYASMMLGEIREKTLKIGPKSNRHARRRL